MVEWCPCTVLSSAMLLAVLSWASLSALSSFWCLSAESPSSFST